MDRPFGRSLRSASRVIAEAADGRLPSFGTSVYAPARRVACARMSVIRPCLMHRCPEYALPGESYCKQHLYRRNDLGLTGARGTSAYWRRVRKVAKQKARFRCEECGKRETVDDMLTVHHRDRNAANNEPENLQALCVECHKAKHKSRLKV
jgi:ribosomal protein L44E